MQNKEEYLIFILDLKDDSVFNQPKVLFRDAVGIALIISMMIYQFFQILIGLDWL